MNVHGIHHEAKTKYAYAFDEKTLHIKLRTVKSDIDEVHVIWGDPFDWGPNPNNDNIWEWNSSDAEELKMTIEYSDNDFDYWFLQVKPEWKRVKYGFVLIKGEHEVLYGSRGFFNLDEMPKKRYNISDYFNFPYINEEDLFKAPKWVKDTVWYQIFPERFANGDKSIDLKGTLKWGSKDPVNNEMLFGGDLQGIVDHLDYIKDLGITGVYFTPIFEASATHKYDTIDYFKIDPAFGSNDLFKTLVKEAHKRGIKIMLDAVFNHCGFKHPYFQDVAEKGSKSKYFDWFHILREPVINFEMKHGFPKPHAHEVTGKLNYETFAFTPNMPKWRTGNPDCEAYLLDVARYWIEEYDIDGWRLDVSNEVSHDFWRKFRRMTKKIKPDLFILGENWDDSNPWLQGDQFDGVMNYEFTFPVWHLLGHEKHVDYNYSPQKFRNAISKLLVTYPKHVAPNMFNLVDSHDTSRILSTCEGDVDKTKLAFVLLLTFGGSPSVYYGSEQGLTGFGDQNRQCMIWDTEKQDKTMHAFIKQLIAIRHSEKTTREIDIHFITEGDFKDLVAYEKRTEDETLLVIMNTNDYEKEVKVPLELQRHYKDLMTSEAIELTETLSLKAKGFRLLKAKL
ncbi:MULTISPECIES: glycoside hydrolase family 13 protein [unclassified Fusibacter]|uniref:glycoside hydrolase family 13 protein n=1 Tax=unclassified Fusibacter TaxID=2624464 RepID=UPI0010112FAF|nr:MULTISPECIES: glycoside hydrolase family 13 protein [unclassified Fusibacter]MCK8059041.1 alpha amylase N-terminal ig-like domain-containing protein [Fusibacter sp. A2]NPE22452.1 glycoside hydrolase family 13 protein [Fusibacter sp. A1]RXV60556.1 glycoside hydrolase family 13 protein [Fusibacter sp. A1]